MINYIKKIYENIITKIVILLTVIINIFVFYHFIVSKFGLETKDLQNIYYFFGTSAQSIATFFAFLIISYALVYQAMDNPENKDDTLIEIHHKLKTDYYHKIIWLAITTGIAIILSLLMIWINGFETSFKNDLVLFAFLFIIIAITGGIWFGINIIDPNKIRKAARTIINEKYPVPLEVVDEGSLLRAFINLERVIRDIIMKYDLQGRTQPRRREFMSFKEMLEILNFNELIPKELYNRLLKISNYRNLVVHGHVLEVDANIVHQAKQAFDEVSNIISERLNKSEL